MGGGGARLRILGGGGKVKNKNIGGPRLRMLGGGKVKNKNIGGPRLRILGGKG